ncbi:unnamed protein product [Cladocopium goreaui]|uniref:Uncharacterized protein n=1 Tax=Cladocopium goreaui TaxID=2562237 RepID=A0A9P1FYI6_9DINO|nr:unnamed protein product [Cladocopium goreaui]
MARGEIAPASTTNLVHIFRRLQMPTLPTSCTSACPSMEAAADQLATAITAANSQTSEQAAQDLFALLCAHRAAFQCAVESGTACEVITSTAVGDLLGSLDCFCTVCTDFPLIYSSLDGFTALLQTGSDTAMTDLYTSMCPQITSMKCVTENSECSKIVQGQSGPLFTNFTQMESTCTQEGYSIGGTKSDFAKRACSATLPLILLLLYLPK